MWFGLPHVIRLIRTTDGYETYSDSWWDMFSSYEAGVKEDVQWLIDQKMIFISLWAKNNPLPPIGRSKLLPTLRNIPTVPSSSRLPTVSFLRQCLICLTQCLADS